MNETLWITLPTSEENKIKEIFNSPKVSLCYIRI